MSLRQNARAFPSAFRAAHSGGVFETGGPRLPIGFWLSTEAADTFAASGSVPTFGSLAATEARDAFAASGTVANAGTSTPTITSPSAQSVAENSPFALTLTASEAGSWAIIGGADQTTFAIATDTLSATAFDYETPLDADGNNTYIVNVRFTSTATGLTADQTITVTVTDVDDTAPTLSSASGTQTGQTTATIAVTTNEANGTLYCFVSTSATPPSATTLKAGTGAVFANSQTISSTGAKSASATGLTASTAYYVHWLHRDAAGNDSTILSSASFTTASAGGGGALAYTQTDSVVEYPGNTGGKVRTYAARNIGTPAADRIVVVQLALVAAVGSTYASVTAGGVALTKVVDLDASLNIGMMPAIFAGLVPTGSTADIVVTLNDSNAANPIVSSAVNIGVLNGSATAAASGTATKARSYTGGAVATSSGLTIPANGIVLALALGNSGGLTTTATWGAGMTATTAILRDGNLYDSTFGKSTGTGSLTPSVTFSTDENNAMVAAAWGP